MKIGEINILVRLAFIVLAAGFFSSCYEDDVIAPDYSGPLSSSIEFISDPMQRYKVKTRAGNIKDDEEKKINNIHIFFFDDEGNYLKGGYLTGYPNAPEQGGYYSLPEGVTSLKIDNETDKFTNPDKADNVTIFAVANVNPSMFPINATTGRPNNVSTLSDLEMMDFSIGTEQLSIGIPKYGIPMVSKTIMNLTKNENENGNENKSHIVELTSLMARIDVNIRLESDITDHNFPSLMLADWTAKNIPVKGTFTAPSGNSQTGEKWSGESWKKNIKTTAQKTIYNKNGNISFSFYMFENIQKAEWKKDDGEIWQKDPNPGDLYSLYPSEIIEKDENKYQMQRYKPYLANKNAAAVELHAFYSTYNENAGSNTATSEVFYTLYLGANYTDNFEVKRNHRYENNITIKGLTKSGSDPNRVTFDARVNVTNENNKYYISILNERKHDAHFCVTPMDVYLFEDNESRNSNPTMEVIIGEVPNDSETPTGIPDWIRVERISATDMEKGTVSDSHFTEYISPGNGTHLATNKSWCAGNGKRAFFTKDLLTNTLKESGKRARIQNTRDRVYFYIDENLKLEDREAVVTLIYKENGTEIQRRTLKIVQTHLLPVTIQEDYKNSEVQLGNTGASVHNFSRTITIYMEQYEEYLDHYDPLDEHRTEQIYDGLPWGCNGVSIPQKDIYLFSKWVIFEYKYYSNLECSHNWYLGLPYTNEIVSQAGHGVMTMNDIPRSAAEYCYNRNKRNDNGSVSNGKYFLPGIRQMEAALTKYYTTFSEFQNNYYWSSAAGEKDHDTSGQNKSRARATKVRSVITNPNDKYEQSGGAGNYYYEQIDPADGEPRGGYALRTEKLRIRAFRVDLK